MRWSLILLNAKPRQGWYIQFVDNSPEARMRAAAKQAGL